MTETQLQEAIIELAGVLGWRHYHTYDSRRSGFGFPDLVLVRVLDRPGGGWNPRLIFAELKGDDARGRRGKVTEAQQAWLDDLAEIQAFTGHQGESVVRAVVWTPDEWKDGTIEKLLRGGA